MLSRASSIACLSLAVSLASGTACALELPLPPPGEDIVGQVQVIQTAYEDTFADLGERYDLGYSEMVAANPGVDAWLPGVGTEVVLPTRFILPPGPREGVVINIAEYRMYYYPKGGNTVFTYPLGIGREGWGSPVGVTRITTKIKDPSWYPPASIRAEHAADGDPLPTVVPPGPDNPLGPYKMNLALAGYLIHGSNKKFGIGMQVSHGCFRMLNEDLREFVGLVPVNTPVRIINEPYKFGISEGKLYLEAHEPLSSENGKPAMIDRHTAVVNAMIRREDLNGQAELNWELVKDIVTAQDGLPVEVAAPNASEPAQTANSTAEKPATAL